MSKPSPLQTVTHIAAWKPLSQVLHRVRPRAVVHRAASRRIAVSLNLPFVASRSILDRPTSGTAFQLE
jgi:hypothetical protein